MDETFSVEIPSTVKLLPAKPRPAVVSPMPVKDPLRRNFLLFIIFILLIKGKESVEVWEYGSMGVLGRIFIPILPYSHTSILSSYFHPPPSDLYNSTRAFNSAL